MSPLVADGNLEIEGRVGGVGLALADIVGDAAAPQGGAGEAVLDALVLGDEAHVPGAVDEDDVFGHQVVVVRPAAAQALDEGPDAGDEFVVEILGHAAEAEEAIGEAGAGDPVQEVQDMFPVIKAVHDGGEGPQVQEIGAEPQEVGSEAVEFAQDHPDVFGPLRHGDADELLHRHAVALVVGQGVEVIHPAHVGQELHGSCGSRPCARGPGGRSR